MHNRHLLEHLANGSIGETLPQTKTPPYILIFQFPIYLEPSSQGNDGVLRISSNRFGNPGKKYNNLSIMTKQPGAFFHHGPFCWAKIILFQREPLYLPGDSSRDLFIPNRWRSPTTLEFGSRDLSIPKKSPAESPSRENFLAVSWT